MVLSGLKVLDDILKEAHGEYYIDYVEINENDSSRKISYNRKNDNAKITMSGKFSKYNDLGKIPRPIRKKDIIYRESVLKKLSEEHFPVIEKNGQVAKLFLLDKKDARNWVRKIDEEMSKNLTGNPTYTIQDGMVSYSFPEYNKKGEPIFEINRQSKTIQIENTMTSSPREAMKNMKKTRKLIKDCIKTEEVMHENGEKKIKDILHYWETNGNMA